MIKIEAVIRPQRLEDVKAALADIDQIRMTVNEVRGAGAQGGYTQHYRGAEYTVNLIQKVKIEIVALESHVDDIVNVIVRTARTGEVGDGKIFLSRIDEVVRIRTDERGESAV